MSHSVDGVLLSDVVLLEVSDLPLHCPMPKSPLWSEHPRVFLSFDPVTGQAKCPYCSAQYQLADGVHAPSVH
jgi:uncharacterized Zn-finger protein